MFKLNRLVKKDGKAAAIILFILVAVIIVAVLIFTGVIKINFGEGGFGGLFPNNSSGESSDNTSDAANTTQEEQSNTVIIKIDDSNIYIDDVLCADETELKEKIMEIGTKKEYELIHDTAIKATYDKVVAVLYELEDALEIKINYNNQ